MRNITTLLFDLGGVLIELGPVRALIESSPHDPDRVWQNWIHSDTVRRFESGNCSAQEFAVSMIEQLDLQDTPETFLERFRQWPRGSYPNAETLLDNLASHYRLVCLSNTNPVHFDDFLRHQPLMSCFHHAYLSHQTGVLKPDAEAFHQVIRDLDLQPDEILFLDDNPGNITAASDIGIHSVQVHALDGVLDALNRYQLRHL